MLWLLGMLEDVFLSVNELMHLESPGMKILSHNWHGDVENIQSGKECDKYTMMDVGCCLQGL